MKRGETTRASATGQEQKVGEFRRRPWTSASWGGRTLADIKHRDDAIRRCFRKITLVTGRRSLLGDESGRSVRAPPSQREGAAARSGSIRREEGLNIHTNEASGADLGAVWIWMTKEKTWG